MQILILGGAGFLGRRLAEALADRGTLRGEEIAQVALADAHDPSPVVAPFPVTTHPLDVADRGAVDAMMAEGWDVIFHLAAVVSGEAERDFVKGMRANFFGTLNVLEAARAEANRPVLVFASSVAVYGGAPPEPVQDWTALNPQTSYGTQKAIGELLVNDYGRRGLVDGRGVRLPTVVVRPGKPNAAASSFFSGIIREPLQGEPAICPVDPATTAAWVASPRATIDNLIRAAELEAEALGTQRCFALPGLSVTVEEMLAALQAEGGRAARDLVDVRRDPEIEAIVEGWVTSLETPKADALGMVRDPDYASIVRQFVEDELEGGEG